MGSDCIRCSMVEPTIHGMFSNRGCLHALPFTAPILTMHTLESTSNSQPWKVIFLLSVSFVVTLDTTACTLTEVCPGVFSKWDNSMRQGHPVPGEYERCSGRMRPRVSGDVEWSPVCSVQLQLNLPEL